MQHRLVYAGFWTNIDPVAVTSLSHVLTYKARCLDFCQ